MQDSTGWRVRGQGGGGCGVKKGKGEKDAAPTSPSSSSPLFLVNSPPRRLIQSFPEQYSSCCGGGPATWRPYGLQTAEEPLTLTSTTHMDFLGFLKIYMTFIDAFEDDTLVKSTFFDSASCLFHFIQLVHV